MHKSRVNIIFVIFLFLLMGFPNLLAAQNNDDPSVETDWDDYFYDLYVKGDQTFIISLGTVFPVLFIKWYNDPGERIIDMNFTPPVGGTGSLTYNYYFGPKFFIGGEVAGMFIHTLGENSLFIVPLGLRVGTQYIYRRFEFPLSLSVGMTWHTYLIYGYYGLYVKAGGSAYFRATNDWSFGLTTNLGWFPEWTDDKKNNVDGSFVDILFSARYHF